MNDRVAALRAMLRARMHLPAICAPMFLVSNPALVAAACGAGLMGALPRRNARTIEQFDDWLGTIADNARQLAATRGGVCGPIAISFGTQEQSVDMDATLRIAARRGVSIVITAGGDPSVAAAAIREHGLWHFHDVTTLAHARKAIAVGVDGLVCIGAGGGGHAGTLSPLALIPAVRTLFDGVIVMAGAVADGAAIRAAEILGADLAYVGTRFIASAESGASDAYKKMIVEASAADLIFMAGPTAAPASWLRPSLLDNNIAPETPGPDFQQQPGIRPWKTLWSAGQSVELIGDVPTTSAIISRLTAEYDFACSHPRWRDAASTRSPARA